MDYSLIIKFGISILLGALVGLEREIAFKQVPDFFAGFRTFIIITFIGSLSAYLADIYNVYFLIVATAGIMIFIVVTYIISNLKTDRLGSTTELAVFFSFLIGVVTYQVDIKIGVILAIVLTLILSLKPSLHNFAIHMNNEEFFSTIKFAIIAFVILPLLPNEGFGPMLAFNPYQIWLMVVLVSALSFLVYLAIKIFGPEKGIVLTGLLGGLLSSTALTVSISQKAKQHKDYHSLFAFAVVLASSTMFLRVLILIAIVYKPLVQEILVPMLLMFAVGFIFSLILFHYHHNSKGVPMDYKSPFRIAPALKFGIFFAVILFLTKLAVLYLGTRGIYLLSFFSGLADVDPIVLSLASLAKSEIALKVAGVGIIIATATNTLLKIGIAYTVGSPRFAGKVATVMSLSLIVGLIAIII